MSNFYQVHQGDVLLLRIGDKRPEGEPVAKGRVVLAYGEATGHSHVMEQEGLMEFLVDGKRMVWVVAPTTIQHQEHDFEISTGIAGVKPVIPGLYEVVEQFDEWTQTRLQD